MKAIEIIYINKNKKFASLELWAQSIKGIKGKC
jgi:hypothetical protein